MGKYESCLRLWTQAQGSHASPVVRPTQNCFLLWLRCVENSLHFLVSVYMFDRLGFLLDRKVLDQDSPTLLHFYPTFLYHSCHLLRSMLSAVRS
jgi:hypothetical protein